MNCPVCLSTMRCESEVHKLSYGKSRFDLHCFNLQCPARKEVSYTPCVCVIRNDPHPWVAYAYYLPFKFGEEWVALVGEKKSLLYGDIDLKNFLSSPFICSKIEKIVRHNFAGIAYSYPSYVLEYFDIPKPLIELLFIPLSTDNDMHIDAKRIFNKLKNLSSLAE